MLMILLITKATAPESVQTEKDHPHLEIQTKEVTKKIMKKTPTAIDLIFYTKMKLLIDLRDR